MNLKSQLSIFLLGAIAVTLPVASAQQPAPQASAPAAAARPAFEVISIKPFDPNGRSQPVGFFSYPGGRVILNVANVKMILYFAYDMQDYQIAGGPDWIGSERYTIVALPPDSSPSRAQKMAPFKIAATDEQKKMLQSLLADRFGFKAPMETRQGEVYILSRGKNKLQLQEPKDKDVDWRGAVVDKGGLYDGEAFGINISMASLASQLSRPLRLPVLDQTGLTGAYDFHLPPVDPENHDYNAAIFDAMHRLGLELKRGKGPVETMAIDHIEKPSAN